MRVGIEVNWESVSNGDSSVDADIDIYTQNRASYSDGQKLSYGGSISGSLDFTNNSGTSSVLRDTKDYDHSYSSSSYGSSPGNRTFSVSLSGAYNGVTPSVSVTEAIPARPIAGAVAPSSVSASRLSDTSTQISWVNNSTPARPWQTVYLLRSVNGAAYTVVSSSISGAASSYTDATTANNRYEYAVAAANTAGASSYINSNLIWTTPSAPASALRTPSGGDQVITWTNTAGYGEYVTEIYSSANNAAYTLLATKAAGVTTHTHVAASPSTKWKYAVRHVTNTGPALGGAFSNETTQTAGTTSPPAAPTGLVPNGISIDPTLLQALTWTFNLTTIGDTQTKYEVRHRLQGATTWTSTGVVSSATSQYNLPANTYSDGQSVEWQVATHGADATQGPFSTSATFTNTITPITLDPIKLPVVYDVYTGELEASYGANEIRDYVMRAQAVMQGGSLKTVDGSTKEITWSTSNIFRTLSLGRSTASFPTSSHGIQCPYGWVVTNKALAANVATLTLSLGTGPNKLRVGETIVVAGVDATFNGTFVVTESTTTTVSYAKVASNVSIVAATGTAFAVITGHGGAANTFPSGGKIQLQNYETLWYELPFGWGAGGTARKNGVVAVTNKALTTNVATLTVVKPHYFAVGDLVVVSIGDAVFDGQFTITGMAGNSISYAKVNANVASAAATGLASPVGEGTFFGNYHVVGYTSGPFIVPSTWVMIAYRDGDQSQIQWADGSRDTGWIAPTLLNSWVNFAGGFSGASYRRLDGVVYVRGLLKNGVVGVPMFTLPAGFRPLEHQMFAGITNTQTGNTGAQTAGTAHTHQVAMQSAGCRINCYATGDVYPEGAWIQNGYVSICFNFPAEA